MKKLTLLLTVLTLAFSIIGQQTSTGTTSCDSEKEIDINAEKLSANYHGNNLVKIFREIRKKTSLVRDEFETTKQFNERVQKENQKPILGNLNFENLFAFEYEGLFKYDADNERMSIELNLDRLPYKNVCAENAITKPTPALPGKTKPSTVPMSTPEAFISTGLNLSIPIEAHHQAVWKNRFSLPITNAKQVKPNLRILLVVKLQNNHQKWHDNIGAELREIWVYNIETGEIYQKTKADVLPKFNSSETVAQEEERLLSEAREFYKSKLYEEAKKKLRQLIATSPMSAEGYLLLSKIKLDEGDLEMAMSHAKTTLFWDNKLIDAHILLGQIYLQKKDCNQARLYADSALKIDSQNKDAIDFEVKAAKCN